VRNRAQNIDFRETSRYAREAAAATAAQSYCKQPFTIKSSSQAAFELATAHRSSNFYSDLAWKMGNFLGHGCEKF
jgi:hypothetical protein